VALIEYLRAALQQTFWVLYDGGLFILAGFAIAGAVHVFLRPERIVRYLGGRNLRSALAAALLGAPLPLCSCGVIPTALSLRRKGASREATLSFLVSTPETGVDAMVVTFAFFGPLMTVIRPVVAIITGLIAAAALIRRPETGPDDSIAIPPTDLPDLHQHDHESAPPPSQGSVPPPSRGGGQGEVTRSWRERVRSSARLALGYGFNDLFDELGFWLALAIITTGILSALVPADFFTRLSPSPFATMLFMAALSAPLYVCASASTPLAALFVAKGASAGAALVFLLVGPATNAATLGAVTRVFGRPFLRVYLGAIIGVALAAGLLVDMLFPNLGASVTLGQPAGAELLGLPKLVGAIALAWLLGRSLWRTGIRPGVHELVDNAAAAWGWVRSLRLRDLLASRALQCLAALWLLSLLAGGFMEIGIGHQGLRQRLGHLLGQPHPPGLLYALPVADRIALVNVDEVRNRAIGFWVRENDPTRIPIPEEALFVTADENVIDLRVDVQFQVADAARYRLGVEAPDDIVVRLARARLVEAMANRPIDRVYTDERAEVEGWLTARTQEDADAAGLGVHLLAVRLLDVHAPGEVHDAFRDVASAHEDRLRTIHQANEYAVQTVALARGDAERIVADADAQAVGRTSKAAADATAFTALAAEERRAPQLTRDRLYLEAVERALPGARKIIRAATGAPRGYELWLRRDGATVTLPPGAAAPAPAAQSGARALPPSQPAGGTQ